MKKSALLIALCLMVCACYAGAATITQTADIPIQTTDWSKVLQFNQFDPTRGTLNSISFTLNGIVRGNVQVENQNATAATVSTTLQATLTLRRPDLTPIVITIPNIIRQFDATAYDDTLDFDGTSGISYPTTSASHSETVSGLSSAADKALFTGFGTISLPCTASGFAGGSGAANLALLFSAESGANASVTYDYTPVPEPSGLIALISGIGSLAGFAVRRRK